MLLLGKKLFASITSHPHSMFDFSIDLRILRDPLLENGNGGLAQICLKALSLGQLPGGTSPSAGSSSLADLRTVTVSLFSSTDRQLSSDDSLLVKRGFSFPVTLTPINSAITFDTKGLALAEGSYYLIARVEGTPGAESVQTLANNQSVQLVNAKGADPVLVWTSCALNAIKSAGSNGKPGVPPTAGTRLMAMLSATMLDTLAAFGDQVKPYRIDHNAPVGASLEAALAGAAQRILSLELPGETRLFQDQLTRSLQSLQASQASIQSGLAFGSSLADQIRSLRSADGSTNTTPYTPPSGLPGYVWRPATTGSLANVALGANWGSVTPWVISGVNAFRSDGLQARPDVNLDLYAQPRNEVR